jgi:hypothetical protein
LSAVRPRKPAGISGLRLRLQRAAHFPIASRTMMKRSVSSNGFSWLGDRCSLMAMSLRSRTLGRLSAPNKSRNRSGPSLTTLAHAHPFADFNLHNRHSRKNQLLRKNLGSTLTATGAFPPARMARSARPVVEGQNVSVEQHWLEGHYERTPALVAEAARQRCGSGTVPACFRCAFWSAKA